MHCLLTNTAKRVVTREKMFRSVVRSQAKNAVLVDAVRTPFLRSHTQYAAEKPHDLLRMGPRYISMFSGH